MNVKYKSEETDCKKVVVIGGGTGQSIFLRGLKNYTNNISAVVTVMDNGGSSGLLREDLGMLPPGDIRNCLLALANIEPVMQEVMQYRFTAGKLKGQNFGNLFIAAMQGISDNFVEAVVKMSQFLAVKGRVLPVTLEDIHLIAELENGKSVKGEAEIPKEVQLQKTKIKRILLSSDNVKPYPPVLEVIKNADIVVIGPGSLFTSIIPNLLIKDVVKTLKQSKALKVYAANVMTQPGETLNYNVIDHINVLEKHIGKDIIDVVIANNKKLSKNILQDYSKAEATQILLDEKQREDLKARGIKYIESNVIEFYKGYIRHDADKLSNIIIDLDKRF